MDVGIAEVIHIYDALGPEEFERQIGEVMATHPTNPLFLLFSGEKSVEGKSWCGDCVRAEPIILTALEEYTPDAVLVIFNVNREEYRKQDFPYRVNPKIQLRCVPTLHRCP